MIKWFVDLDGVLADFNAEFRSIAGFSWSNNLKAAGLDKWKIIREKAPTFFEDLPLIPGAMNLWNLLLPFEPIILSAAAMPPKFIDCKTQKRAWCQAKLVVGDWSPVVILVDRPQDKQNYCLSFDDILIDDNDQNILQWHSRGGRAIKFYDTISTIRVIQQIIGGE